MIFQWKLVNLLLGASLRGPPLLVFAVFFGYDTGMQERKRENVDFAVNSRIKAVRLALNLRQGDFCKSILISPSHYTEIELGHRRVNERTISLVCSTYGVNPGYLSDGEGSMFAEEDGGKIEQLCRVFRELPPDFQDHLLRYVREMKALAAASPGLRPE